jgi:hypothetical protein
MTMAHLALFLPLQVLLQALFLQKTVLFMPVLYIPADGTLASEQEENHVGTLIANNAPASTCSTRALAH